MGTNDRYAGDLLYLREKEGSSGDKWYNLNYNRIYSVNILLSKDSYTNFTYEGLKNQNWEIII